MERRSFNPKLRGSRRNPEEITNFYALYFTLQIYSLEQDQALRLIVLDYSDDMLFYSQNIYALLQSFHLY